MNDPATFSFLTDSKTQSLVCIDGQFLDYIKPFREFLTSNGLQVIENSITDIDCLYHIVVIGSNQVKDIFSRGQRHAIRRLIILLDNTMDQAQELATIYNAKVAVIGERLIEQDEPRVVFGFLCDDNSTVIDLRKEKNLPEKTTVIHTQALEKPVIKDEKIFTPIPNTPENYWDKDKERIRNAFNDVYKQKKAPRKIVRIFRNAARVILAFVLLYISTHVLSVILAGVLLFISFKLHYRPQQVAPLISFSGTLIRYADVTYQPLPLLFPIPPVRLYERVLSSAEQTTEIFYEINQLQNLITPSTFFSSSTKNAFPQNSLYTQVSLLRNKGGNIKQKISLLLADLSAIEKSTPSMFSFKNILSRVYTKGKNSLETMDTLLKLSTVYPLLAPSGETKTYLLLFQNSMELRPTGGFIGSIGELVIKDGVVDRVNIEDVYSYDGQLRGHVDPPLPIRTILSQEHWYLRDSNWDPDFEISGEKAAWFFEKSGGDHVDGVISINLPFLQELLKATGPIRIAEASEPITAETLFPLIHKRIEENFFPGSTQKKDLLGSIFRKLLEEVTQNHTNPLFLTTAISHGLANGNISVMARDKTALELLHAYRWSGSFSPPTTCRANTSCIEDFIYPVEANLGVNKANAGVSRKITKEVVFSEHTLQSKDTLIIENQSSSTNRIGGDYTTYTRLYYPANVDIQSVDINGQRIPITEASTGARTRPYVEKLKEKPLFTTLGIAVDVAEKGTTYIIIHGETPIQSGTTSYAFSFKAQPGTGEVPVELKGKLDTNTSVKTVLPAIKDDSLSTFIAVSDGFEYTTRTDRNKSVLFLFENL